MSTRFWKAQFWKIVLLPVVAALLLAGVSLFRGYLHRQAGFDGEGRPVDPSPSSPEGPNPKEEPNPKIVARRPISFQTILTQIRDDLVRVDDARRSDCRYFSLGHRYNDPTCTDEVIERDRQALREMIRLLSPADKTAQATAIDAEQLVFRIQLSHLGWADEQWRELIRHYRYGLSYAGSANAAVKEADNFVRAATGTVIPVVRADWFVASLVRPPLGGPGGSLGLWTKTPPKEIRLVGEAYYSQPVGLEVAARELGVEKDRLRASIAGDEVLRDTFRLGPWLNGQTVPREWWESDSNLTSPFQELARRFGVGKPVILR